MKVSDAYNVSLAASQRVRRRRRLDGVEEPASATPTTDQVYFSGRSMEVSRARHLALRAPEIRVALVDSISDQIRHGQYDVSGSDVAPKLIQDHLMIAQA
ncbi:MAG: flagellar biosynthesis anti-sigma factor FlgM [Deferrisomatales bacterium]|nr:flagellar biosynthesis anti-sigma factor FlgM [Deferrisomatales bacterium]